ncbi:MAG: SUF system NifU family Fe-S cluster assembly protein [Bacillus subtilis]|nr:SUF system NifU family Fe-S cluster assembly protein [Bacillus subtilis]
MLDDPTFHTFHIKNPSCGDDITVQTKIEQGVITACRHDGHGCSICCSSASVLTETMTGKTVEGGKTIANAYLAMVKNQPYEVTVDLEEASVYEGIRQFPARVKCASIAWQAFLETLK